MGTMLSARPTWVCPERYEPEPDIFEWMPCTRYCSGSGRLIIDNNCMDKQFKRMGEEALSQPSIQESFRKAGIGPQSTRFHYAGDDFSFIMRTKGDEGQDERRISCSPTAIGLPFISKFTSEEATQTLRAMLHHEIGHIVHEDIELIRASRNNPLAQTLKHNMERRADAFAISHTKDSRELEAVAKIYSILSNMAPGPTDTHPFYSERAQLFSCVAGIRAAKPVNPLSLVWKKIFA